MAEKHRFRRKCFYRRNEIRRSFFWFIIAFSLVSFCLYGQSSGNESPDHVIHVLNESFGSNFPDNRISFEERPLLSAYGGFGTSVLVRCQDNTSSGESKGTFVLAVPLYAKFAVDTALALAETLRHRQDNSIDIYIAFLGDEKNDLSVFSTESPVEDPEAFFSTGVISHKGLRDILSLTSIPENWVLCYFDADEVPLELILHHGRRGYVTPLEIIKPLLSLLKAAHVPWSFEIRHAAIYKLGLAEGPEALGIIWSEEVNGFVLSGKTGSGKNVSNRELILPAGLAEILIEYSKELNFPVINPDRHYSFFNFPGGNFFFAGEGFTVILLLLTAAIVLSFYLIYYARYNAILLYHFRLFFRSFWVFSILLPLMVLSLKASGFLYSMLLRTLDPLLIRTLTGSAGNIGAGLTVFLAILVFIVFSPILNIIRFPMRSRFYGFSAVIFIVAGTLSAAFLDFSFVPIFLWASLFVFMGVSVSRPILVLLCAISIPLFASLALFDLLGTENGRFAELFFPQKWSNLESWIAAIQTALLSLPIFLLFKRGTTMLKQSKKPVKSYKLIVLPALFIAVLSIMFVQILVIGSRTPPERRLLIDVHDPGILSVTLDEIVFQDSRIVNLRLEAGGSPIRFDVSFESEDEKTLLPVYSAAVPFEREAKGRRIVFFLGEGPPNPLTLEIVLPLEFEGILKTQAIYNDWDPGIDPEGKPESSDYVFVVSKSRKI